MSINEELNELNMAFLKSLEEDNSFGLNEEIKTIEFKCRDNKKIDDVPEFVVADFQIDLKRNEKVEIECPFYGGIMHRARKISK